MDNNSQTVFQQQLAEAEKAVKAAKDRYDLMASLESIMRDGTKILNLIKNIELPLVTENDFSNPEALKDEVDIAVSQIFKAAKALNPHKVVKPRAERGTRQNQILEMLNDGQEHKAADMSKSTDMATSNLYGILAKMAKTGKIVAVGQGLYRKNVETVHPAKKQVTREMAAR